MQACGLCRSVPGPCEKICKDLQRPVKACKALVANHRPRPSCATMAIETLKENTLRIRTSWAPLWLQKPVLATVGLFAACAALAQTPPPAPAHRAETHAATEPAAAVSPGELKAQREFKMLDFNGDGKLSRSEVKLFPRLAAAFDEADTDGDGFVSYAEVRAFAAKYRAERDRQRAAAQAAATPSAPTASPPAPEARP